MTSFQTSWAGLELLASTFSREWKGVFYHDNLKPENYVCFFNIITKTANDFCHSTMTDREIQKDY